MTVPPTNGHPMHNAVKLFAPRAWRGTVQLLTDWEANDAPAERIEFHRKLLWSELLARSIRNEISIVGLFPGDVKPRAVDAADVLDATPCFRTNSLILNGVIISGIRVRLIDNDISMSVALPSAKDFRRKTGPQPKERNRIKSLMLDDLRSGKTTVERLQSADTLESLRAAYGAGSNDTITKAKAAALSEFAEVRNSEK